MVISTDNRAISTVLDVAMALLLISASALVVGLYLANDDTAHDPDSGHRAAELLTDVTLSVRYDISDVTDRDSFSEPDGTPTEAYTRTEYGSAAGLLADAAVTSVHIGSESVTPNTDAFETAVDATTASAFVGTDLEFYAVATWEPYENASISGDATAGERAPVNVDVSSATLNVSSGFRPIDADRVVEEYEMAERSGDDGIDAASGVLAEMLVEGFFPPESSQHALENQGLQRSLTISQYLEFGAATGIGLDEDDDAFERTTADAPALNAKLTEGLTPIIATDLEDDPELAAEIEAIEDEGDTEREELRAAGDAIANRTEIEDATVTVHSWQP